MPRRVRERVRARADQGCTGPRRILSRTTRPCLSSSRWPRNDREVSRSAPPPRIRSTALAAAAIAAGAVRWGPVMGRRPRVDGRGGGRAVCGPAAYGRADDGRSPDGASHASRRRRPSRIRDATQSRTGTSPGRARPNCTSSTSGRPRRTAPFRPARPPTSDAGGANAPTPSAASAGTVSWEINPAARREIERACETCAGPPNDPIVDAPLEPPMNGRAPFGRLATERSRRMLWRERLWENLSSDAMRAARRFFFER